MKKSIALAAALAAAVFAYTLGSAQESSPYADVGAAFRQIDPDQSGTVSQPIMHVSAGDVLAVYIGHAPRQMFSKQDELFYVISGYGTANVGYPAYALKPGSLLSIPRSTAFEITSAGNAPIKALLIASPSNDPNDKHILQQ